MSTIYYVISSFVNIPFRVKHFVDRDEATCYYNDRLQRYSKEPDLTVNIVAEVNEGELMTQRHKHADILIAIAEGKTVQYKTLISGEWVDYSSEGFSPLFCADEYEWRVKPEVKKIKIAIYINTNTNELKTYYYGENDNHNHVPKVLTFLNSVVVEVPEYVYENYFG